jgi:hypothetical protein
MVHRAAAYAKVLSNSFTNPTNSSTLSRRALDHALQRELHGHVHVFESFFFGLTLPHHAGETRNGGHIPTVFRIGIDDHHELPHFAFL